MPKSYLHITLRHERGAAEIELILVIPLLLTLLFLVEGELLLGTARVDNVRAAHETAFRDATIESSPTLTNSDTLEPLNDALSAALPSELPPLPTRSHVSDTEQTIQIKSGGLNLPAVTLVNKTGFTSPSWAFSNWPVTSDDQRVQDWMKTYGDESKADLEAPLQLSPSWPP